MTDRAYNCPRDARSGCSFPRCDCANVDPSSNSVRCPGWGVDGHICPECDPDGFKDAIPNRVRCSRRSWQGLQCLFDANHHGECEFSHHSPGDGHATRNREAITKDYLIRDALYGLGFEVRQMRDTPLDKLDVLAALKHIEDEVCRIAKGEVSESDLIG